MIKYLLKATEPGKSELRPDTVPDDTNILAFSSYIPTKAALMSHFSKKKTNKQKTFDFYAANFDI